MCYTNAPLSHICIALCYLLSPPPPHRFLSSGSPLLPLKAFLSSPQFLFLFCTSLSLTFLYFNCKPSPFHFLHIEAFPFLLSSHLSSTLLLYLNLLATGPINCVDVIFGAVHCADESVCESYREWWREGERAWYVCSSQQKKKKKVRWKWHRLFHQPVPSLLHHFQPIITPPPYLPPAHQNTPSPPPLTTSYCSLSLSLFRLSLFWKSSPFASKQKYPSTTPHPYTHTHICSVIQSWRQSAERWVMMFSRNKNAGTSASPSRYYS